VKVVISGGTGFIGRALVHALIGRGDDAVVLTRGEARSIAHRCGECGAGAKVQLVSWTPEEPGDWQKTIDGADAVVHLAGANIGDARWTPERMELIRSSRVRSGELIAQAIAAAEKKPRVYVSASATGYYGTSTGSEILTEESPNGDDFLARVCHEWEASADAAHAAGVRVRHPRFGIVLGAGSGILAKMVPMFKAYVGGPIGDGEQYVPWIHVRDLVSGVLAMIDRDDLDGAYNLTAPDPVTMNELADTLGEVLHRPAAMRVPGFAVKLALGHELGDVVLSGQRAIPKRLVDGGFAFVFPELASALADLV